MRISDLIKQSVQLLKHSDQPRFEAELLLSYVLEKDRSYIFAHPDTELNLEQTHQFDEVIVRRSLGEPIAYIMEEKEFWSLSLEVTPDTLIPRPETELLVEQVLEKLPKDSVQRVLDLGTGCGAIALVIASERPNWEVVAIDLSEKALTIARKNAKKLKLENITFFRSRWFENLPKMNFHAIVSNPPYIDKHDQHLNQGDVRFEPQQALVSEKNGLKDIKEIISKAEGCLVDKGWLMLEHGYNQGEAVRKIMEQTNFQEILTQKDLAGAERVTLGCLFYL